MGAVVWGVALTGAMVLGGLLAAYAAAVRRLGAAFDRHRRVVEDVGRALGQAVHAGWAHERGDFHLRVCKLLVPILLRYPDRVAALYAPVATRPGRVELPRTDLPFSTTDAEEGRPSLLALALGELGFLRDADRHERVVAVGNLAALALAARAALGDTPAEVADRELLMRFAEEARDEIGHIAPGADAWLPVEGDRLDQPARPGALQVVPDGGYDNPRHASEVVSALSVSYRQPDGDRDRVPALVSLAARTGEPGLRRPPLARLVPLPDAGTPTATWRMAALPVAAAALFAALALLALTR